MNFSTSDPIDFLADDVMPNVASMADQATEHLAELPAALGAIIGSTTARSWTQRGISRVTGRFPLALGATLVAAGAIYLWRRQKSKDNPKPTQFPTSTSSDKPSTTSSTNGSDATVSDRLTAPTKT